MKKLFQAIRNREIQTIKNLILDHPEYVNAVAKAPPIRDDGQSPLQVALRCRNFNAAHFLLEQGADVCFIEQPALKTWKKPVLHDAVIAVASMARFEIINDTVQQDASDYYRIDAIKENFDQAFVLLKKMLQKGADVNVLDSHGNSVLLLLCLEIEAHRIDKKRALAYETIEDLRQLFDLLIQSGAHLCSTTAKHKSVRERFPKLLKELNLYDR
nr:ankyrin repeat domain-containing protein [Acinetobacter sp. Marseille-Q1620]